MYYTFPGTHAEDGVVLGVLVLERHEAHQPVQDGAQHGGHEAHEQLPGAEGRVAQHTVAVDELHGQHGGRGVDGQALQRDVQVGEEVVLRQPRVPSAQDEQPAHNVHDLQVVSRSSVQTLGVGPSSTSDLLGSSLTERWVKFNSEAVHYYYKLGQV